MTIKIVSSCLIAGKHAAVGTVHTVEKALGHILLACGKAIEHAGEVVEYKGQTAAPAVQAATNPPVVEIASAKPTA